jgi:uncharacterized protein
MPIRANALVVMAKAPIPGAVKTRLVPFLSPEEAAELARALLVDQLRHLSAIDNADCYLAFSPEEAGAMMRELAPERFELFSQKDGDLGARMENIFTKLFAKGHRHVVLIGADLPPVPLTYFSKAFASLSDTERCAVLGPSQDGGYYLIGLNRDQPALFDQMTWSHDQVLTQTLARLISLDIKSHLLPTWRDIDTIDDVRCLQSTLTPMMEKTAPRTFSFLRQIKRQ